MDFAICRTASHYVIHHTKTSLTPKGTLEERDAHFQGSWAVIAPVVWRVQFPDADKDRIETQINWEFAQLSKQWPTSADPATQIAAPPTPAAEVQTPAPAPPPSPADSATTSSASEWSPLDVAYSAAFWSADAVRTWYATLAAPVADKGTLADVVRLFVEMDARFWRDYANVQAAQQAINVAKVRNTARDRNRPGLAGRIGRQRPRSRGSKPQQPPFGCSEDARRRSASS